MADNMFGEVPLELQPELQNISQQQKMAQLLLQQGLQQPQGQMISGRYVAPALTQQLAPLLGAYAGSKGLEAAENKQLELANAIRQGKSEALGTFQELMSKPETRGQAMQYAAKNPYLQGMAQELMKPQKLGEGENIIMPSIGGGEPITLAGGGVKIAPEIKQSMQMLGINKPLDQLSPQELQAVNANIYNLKHAGATVVNTGQRGFENTIKLGENFKNEPIYKTHQEINQAYKQVMAGLDKENAAGDYSAAVKISKLLDPNSVVRESEVATVANATGAVDKLANYADKITKGVILNPKQRQEYRQLAKDFYKISGEQYNETRNKYLQIGEQNQLGGVPTILGQPWKPPVEVAPKKSLTANQQLGIPATNLFNQADAIIGNTGK